MEQKPSAQEPKVSLSHYLWLLSLCIGTAIGAGVGAALGHIGAGVGIGIGIGVAVGLCLYQRFKNNSSND